MIRTTRAVAGVTCAAAISLSLLTFTPAQAGVLTVSNEVANRATAAAASSATGTVNTSGGALKVRAGSGTTYHSFSNVKDGAKVTILCQTKGQKITGTYGSSTVWDMLSTGGFVPDSYVDTGSDGRVTDSCDYYGGTLKRANPRGVDAAISWQFTRLGSKAYENLCLNFAAQSYGWAHAGFTTAEVAGDWMASHGYMKTTGVPPRGALVWYHNSAGTGHIVLSLGEGKVIGTSVGGKVGVASYKYRTGYRGWSVPYFPKGSK